MLYQSAYTFSYDFTLYFCQVITNHPDAYQVDCKSIAMSMIRDPTMPNIREYIEFVINRAACACGGEHQFLRYNEAHFDYYFMAVDFEWHTIKQCDSQCMFFFL